ncbi:3-hexulose-6-phosphate synthase [Kineococcus glutinatus]|uniref:3-hexulose-6-phosphate synthase n=1 Tax=Kineococcus glutinatus TaxID=1070872 RepID=A0ABP9H9S2_9ACTN
MVDRTAAPRLQLALDDIGREDLLPLLERVHPFVDIVEVGTPLLMRYGVSLITEIKKRFPTLHLLSDAKIMDAAHHEAALSFEAGADYVTFLALTDDGSVSECVRAAHEHGGAVVADMICVPDLVQRGRQLAHMGVDMLAVHTGVDQQAAGRTPLDDLQVLTASAIPVPLAVAGGINLASAAAYLAWQPHVLIVGSGITTAADPAAEAERLHAVVRGEH